LFDSLPQELLRQWSFEKKVWLELHAPPWDTDTEEAYYRQFYDQMDRWLDQGMGSCVLRRPEIAGMLSEILLHFDGERYRFIAFVVMPNHVHTLFQVISPHDLGNIMSGWRSFSSHQINRILGRKGPLWQDDYWDRILRGPQHYERCLDYIRCNPVKAGLTKGDYILFDKSEEIIMS